MPEPCDSAHGEMPRTVRDGAVAACGDLAVRVWPGLVDLGENSGEEVQVAR